MSLRPAWRVPTVVEDPDPGAARVVDHLDPRVLGTGVPQGVGQALLHHAEAGQRQGGPHLVEVTVGPQLDGEPRGPGPVEQRRQLPEPRRRLRAGGPARGAHQGDRPAEVGERIGGRAPQGGDGAARAVRLVECLGEHAGLDADEGQGVGQHVVELACAVEPLGGQPGRVLALTQPGAQLGVATRFPAGPDAVAEQQQDHHQRDVPQHVDEEGERSHPLLLAEEAEAAGGHQHGCTDPHAPRQPSAQADDQQRHRQGEGQRVGRHHRRKTEHGGERGSDHTDAGRERREHRPRPDEEHQPVAPRARLERCGVAGADRGRDHPARGHQPERHAEAQLAGLPVSRPARHPTSHPPSVGSGALRHVPPTR